MRITITLTLNDAHWLLELVGGKVGPRAERIYRALTKALDNVEREMA